MALEQIIQDSCNFISEISEGFGKRTHERNNFLTTVLTAVKKGDRLTVEKALKGEFPKGSTSLKDITTDIINETATVKQEPKWSGVQSENSSQSNELQNDHKEKEYMPPPTLVPPRKKKIKQETTANEPIRKSARTKGRKNTLNATDRPSERASDIVIQEQPVPMVDLVDKDQSSGSEKSDDCNSAKTTRSTRSKAVKKKANVMPIADSEKEKVAGEAENDMPVRSTRTKTLRRNQKRSVSKSPEKNTLEVVSKKLKLSSSPQKKTVEQTENPKAKKETAYLRGTFTKEPDLGTTYIAEPSSGASLNSTMVIDNPKIVKEDPTTDSAATSSSNSCASPVKQKNIHQNKVNGNVFSPVKSKVNAYEELIKKQNTPSSKANSQLSKATTPVSRLPVVKSCSTSKQQKCLPAAMSKLSSTNMTQSSSAMKASLAEMKERQRLRQEKEKEALRKKEALLQAQMEEKRRKREEKQLKALQQREQLERERSRMKADQVIKVEEKTKKILAEKEEKLQQYKEQQERRRLQAKERYQTCPSYLKTPLPLLPSDSPYDSDDERYQKAVIPNWAKDKRMLLTLCHIPEKVKNTFFYRKIHTPDIVELFEIVHEERMKRTSSAIWDKAPMYSILHVTQDIIESPDSM